MPLATNPNAGSDQEGLPLSATPLGSRARLIDLGDDEDHCATLAAMGLTSDEEIVVHKTGEPTIVSLNCGCGRRIGLSLRVAQQLRVEIIEDPAPPSDSGT